MRGTQHKRLRLLTVACVAVLFGATPALGMQWLRGTHKKEMGDADNAVNSEDRRAQEVIFPVVDQENLPMTPSPSVSTTPIPTSAPSVSTTLGPTSSPTVSPTLSPTISPTSSYTVSPTLSATEGPTTSPTATAGDSSNASLALEPLFNTTVEKITVEEEPVSVFVFPPKAPEATEESEEAEDTDVQKVSFPPTTAPNVTIAPTSAPNATFAPTTAPNATFAPTSTPVAPNVTSEAIDEGLQALEVASELESEAELAPAKETKSPHNSTESPSYRNTFYDGIKWADLPMNAKAAAETLGHDETTWDSGSLVATDSLGWDHLTYEEQMAATILGYDQSSWDAKLDETHEGINEGSASVEAEADTAESGEKQAEETESETETDASDESPEEETEIETEGATEEETQEETTVEGTESIASGNESEETPNYLKMEWAELPETQQTAAADLGYDETTWNQDALVPTSYMRWSKLSFEMREAAKLLGFRQTSWNQKVVETEEDKEAEEEFYTENHNVAAEGEAVTEEDAVTEEEAVTEGEVATEGEAITEEEVANEEGDPSTIDTNEKRGWNKYDTNGGEAVEPGIDMLQTEITVLKRELSDAMEMIKEHEQVLRVLSGLEPEESISSIQKMIQLSTKRKFGGRGQGRRKRDQIIKPVSTQATSDGEKQTSDEAEEKTVVNSNRNANNRNNNSNSNNRNNRNNNSNSNSNNNRNRVSQQQVSQRTFFDRNGGDAGNGGDTINVKPQSTVTVARSTPRFFGGGFRT